MNDDLKNMLSGPGWRDLPTKTIYKLNMPITFGFTDEIRDWLIENVGEQVQGAEVFSRAFETERTRLWSFYKGINPETFEPFCVLRFTDFTDMLFFKMRWYGVAEDEE